MSEIDLVAAARQTAAATITAFSRTGLWIGLFALSAALAALASTFGTLANFAGYALLVLAGSAWAVAIFRELIPIGVSGRFAADTWRVFIATWLFHLVSALIIFIVVLFLIILSVILIVISGYEPPAGEVADVSGSIAALQASGAIWLLYIVMLASSAALIWFGLRLVLFAAATATRGTVLVFQTWGLTKGKVVPIACLAAVFVAAPVGVALFLGDATAATLGLPSTWNDVHAARTGFVQADFLPQLSFNRFLQTLYLVPAILSGHCLSATLYKLLRGRVQGQTDAPVPH